MDKVVVNELAATLAALRASGETGFWIILVLLIAVLALGSVAILSQRIVIARFEKTAKDTQDFLKVIGTNIKAVELSLKERELSVKERDELRNIFNQQFALVKDTNEHLTAKIGRLKEQQQGVGESVEMMLLRTRLTTGELYWLRQLSKNEPALTDTGHQLFYEGFKADILHLRGLKFVETKKGRSGFSALESAPKGNHDVHDYFVVTQEGRDFLDMLDKISERTAKATTPA